jgi:hypothetical protein
MREPLSLPVVQLHFVKFLPKLETLAINKPFECRSAVVRSPSFRPMREGYICSGAGRPSNGKGETAGAELGEAWQL